MWVNLKEQQILKTLKFKLHPPTPIEFICLFISILQQNVNSMETETMLLLRGETCLLSYICFHYTNIQMFKASSIAIACLMHTMEGWSWNTVATRFIQIVKFSVAENISSGAVDLISEDEIL